MIRNEREYNQTRERIDDFEQQLDDMRRQLEEQGCNADDIARALAPTERLLDELRFDRDFYDRLREQGPSAVPDYAPEERGKALIALRIACGLSQRELADKLEVSQAQVSKDERNDYHGITQERFARILDVLNVRENTAGYAPKQAVIIQMPSITVEAASFRPNQGQQFALHIQEA